MAGSHEPRTPENPPDRQRCRAARPHGRTPGRREAGRLPPRLGADRRGRPAAHRRTPARCLPGGLSPAAAGRPGADPGGPRRRLHPGAADSPRRRRGGRARSPRRRSGRLPGTGRPQPRRAGPRDPPCDRTPAPAGGAEGQGHPFQPGAGHGQPRRLGLESRHGSGSDHARIQAPAGLRRHRAGLLHPRGMARGRASRRSPDARACRRPARGGHG